MKLPQLVFLFLNQNFSQQKCKLIIFRERLMVRKFGQENLVSRFGYEMSLF